MPSIPIALPFDVATGGVFPQVMPAPPRIIYDTTAGSQHGAVYTTWATALASALLFVGPVEIYVANGSVVPAGSYTMPASWHLVIDQSGTTVPSGTTFSTSPITLAGEGGAVLTLGESAGGHLFVAGAPIMDVRDLGIVLGASGALVDGANGCGLRMRNVQVSKPQAGMLMAGTANTVVALEQTLLPDDVLPATMNIEYDATSITGDQNGNAGRDLAGGSGANSTFVFDSSGQAGGNTYTTWGSLVAAAAGLGYATIYVPSSGTITAGSYDMPVVWDLLVAGGIVVTVEDGAVFNTLPGAIRSVGSVGGYTGGGALYFESTTTTPWAFSGSTSAIVLLDGVSLASSSNTNEPVFNLAGSGNSRIQLQNGATLFASPGGTGGTGAGEGALFYGHFETGDDDGAGVYAYSGSYVGAKTIQGSDGTPSYYLDPTSSCDNSIAPQTVPLPAPYTNGPLSGLTAPGSVAGARTLAYAPGATGNWGAPLPTTVQEALDRIAAFFTAHVAGGTGTGAID